MNNKILFLQYQDQQLTDKEVKEVEKILMENPDQREILEAVRNKRQSAIDALKSMNPEGLPVIPPVESIISKAKTEKPNKRFLIPPFLRYAAIILVLVALPLGFWVLKNKNQPQISPPAFSETTLSDSPVTEDLDYYISPNRCWNERELVCTVIKLNN
jgi:signal recognition particle subunit SEC65